MKKVIIGIIILALMLSLVSCGAGVKEIESHEGYYLERGNGLYGEEFESISITNYHPYKLWALPKYQELVQYGYVGIENEGLVYYVHIADYSIKTSGDTVSDGEYYIAEFDGETRALLFETGMLFESEEEKSAVVERLLDMMDELK